MTQVADANYQASTTTMTLTVNKATPILSNFNSISKTTDDAAFILLTPASSGGTGLFTYSSSNLDVATIAGNTVTITGSGSTIITATKIADANYNAQSISAQLIVGIGTTQSPVLISPQSNTTGASILNISYTLPETPFAGSVRLTFTPTAGGPPIVWVMNNANLVSFAYPVGTNPTLLSNVVTGNVLAFTTYNVTISYQDVFASPIATTTNTNIQTLASPNIRLAQNNYSGIINVNLIPISVINSGGFIGSFTINPTLPNGLVFNSSTGVISGRPSTVLASSNFMITATNPAGSSATTFILFIDADLDGDGIGDATDPDIDGDGVPNTIEIQEGTNPTDPTDYKDTDGDGVPDYVEVQQGTDPKTPGDAKDTDGDGVPDYIELKQGTDPNLAGDFLDSDGDGLSDYNEGYNFSNPTSSTDNDNNGTPDYLEFNNHSQSEDDLEIFNSMTTNGDGLNDVFVIRGIENYPDNNLYIYNRWGVEVYNVEGYGQDNKYFTGISQGRNTFSQSAELPKGTYYFILRYKNKQGIDKQRSGYLYITK
jgi:gliding motility-associated-like protein